MKKLLVSVRNVEEALLALECGADIIDLKDPSIGALGALDFAQTQDIMSVLSGRSLVSATVGEEHSILNSLINAIYQRVALGVNIIKIAASDVFYHNDFIKELSAKIPRETKLVAVFFADLKLDLALLARLHRMGFYGAMLDTKNKQNGLLQICSFDSLERFVDTCEANGLISGLAGSLKPQDVDLLNETNATYLGFRGGLCENNNRTLKLSQTRILSVKELLRESNNSGCSPHAGADIELHSI